MALARTDFQTSLGPMTPKSSRPEKSWKLKTCRMKRSSHYVSHVLSLCHAHDELSASTLDGSLLKHEEIHDKSHAGD